MIIAIANHNTINSRAASTSLLESPIINDCEDLDFACNAAMVMDVVFFQISPKYNLKIRGKL